jgi:hypothetical protein
MTDAAPAMASSRELWIELLARLSHTQLECGQPDAARRLKELGVRGGTGTVVRHLAREYRQATRMAALCGVELPAQELAHRVAGRSLELMLRDDLDHDFRGLAVTYRQLLLALAPASGSPLHQWLEGRSRVHAAQAQGLASALHHGPPPTDRGGARDPPAAALTVQPDPGCVYRANASEPVLNPHQRTTHE